MLPWPKYSRPRNGKINVKADEIIAAISGPLTIRKQKKEMVIANRASQNIKI